MKHFRFMLDHWVLAVSAIFSSLLSSLLGGVSIAFIFPILSDTQTSAQGSIPFPFDRILLAFSGLGLPEKLRVIALLLVIVFISKSIFQYITIVTSSKLQITSIKHFRMLCYEQLMNVGMGYFNSKKSGEFHTICFSHSQSLGACVNFIFTGFSQLFGILIYLTMGMILSWKLVLTSIAFACVVSLLLKKCMYLAETIGKKYTELNMRFTSVSIELILAMKVIRLFAQEKNEMKRLENEVDLFNQTVYRLTKLRGSVAPLYESMAMIALACIVVAGSFLLIGSNNLGLPSLAAFIVIFQRISGEANAINQKRVNIMGDLPSYREVFRFLSSDGKQQIKSGAKPFKQLKSEIELKDVSFGYNPEESLVLKDTSFCIPKGHKVGVVGPSGAGKSTLAELLLRFYDPQRGQILVDGVDLRELEISSWRRRIGVVSQDVFLFNDTIRHNIAYAMPESTQQEIEEASRKAHAHAFILKLPKGYDTRVGDRGVLLSGGQKQRIAIARAIIIDPEILIFDEATSALDTESERIVQQALDEVGRGRTVITIAHRLSTIVDSDKIVVLESGRISEQGSHQDLLQRDGVYTRLTRMQQLA